LSNAAAAVRPGQKFVPGPGNKITSQQFHFTPNSIPSMIGAPQSFTFNDGRSSLPHLLTGPGMDRTTERVVNP
jgi:hypothetical protein